MKLNEINILFIVIALVLMISSALFIKKLWLNYRIKKASKLMPIKNIDIRTSGDYTNIIFLHHSTGRNIIAHGNLRKLLKDEGYELWDHDYNNIGLTDPLGNKLGACYDIPSDSTSKRGKGNTDPDGLHILFHQTPSDPPDNAFSRLLQHEVIIFKSCFPNSAIKNENQLMQNKKIFSEIVDKIKQFPDNVFIMMTFPPLHPLATTSEEAKRAREMADWLKSNTIIEKTSNLFVFDLFDILADSSNNMLKTEYQINTKRADSHPNLKANQFIGPILKDFIISAIYQYKLNQSQL